MSSSNSSEASNQSPEKKRRFLTAEKKFQIYLEAQTSDQPIGQQLHPVIPFDELKADDNLTVVAVNI